MTESGPTSSPRVTTQEPVKTEVIFTENGETFVQENTYNAEKNEASIKVPAHGNFEATTFLIQGRSSNSAVAGKMVVSSEKSCSLEPIPDFINPEDMSVVIKRSIDARQLKEVKYYQVRSDLRKATDEEIGTLTESMKSECAGKTVIVSSVETIDEEEFLAKGIGNISQNFRRVGRQGRQGRQGLCNNLVYACAHGRPGGCMRLTTPQNQEGNQPLIVHTYTGLESYCTRCCQDPGTPFFPCSCITNHNMQAFSTSFAIARAALNPLNFLTSLDCIKKSRFCKWDNSQSLSNGECSYTTQGSCVNDGCPLDCATQELCNDQYGVMPPITG